MIIILAVIIAAAVFVKLSYFTEQVYVSDGMLYVSNKATSESTAKISQSDILSSRELSATYMEILKARSFLSEVSEASGTGYSWQQIRSMTSISAVNDTELLTISVCAPSPDDAYILAKTILDHAPGKLTSIFSSGEVEIVNNAVRQSKPVDNGVIFKTVIGFAVGAVLGAVISVLLGLFDTKVHKSEDITKRYGVSLLGELV